MNIFSKSCVFIAIMVSITVVLSSCGFPKEYNYKTNCNVSGKIINVKYNVNLTEEYFNNPEHEWYIPQYYKPSSENPNDGELYVDQSVFQYLISHKDNFICYMIEASIFNNGSSEIYGYKFQLSKDYGTSVILWEVFDIEGFEIWKPGESMSVYIPLFIDTMKYTSDDEIKALVNDLSLLFTYETVAYPTKAIDDFFGWLPDSQYVGEDTITIR